MARRAGIAPAYLHAIEGATANHKTDKPSKVSVPVLRSIAAAIPGALASELLELAGWEDDAAYDRVKEAQAARAAKPAATTLGELSGRLDAIEERIAAQEATMDAILRAVTEADRHLGDQGT